MIEIEVWEKIMAIRRGKSGGKRLVNRRGRPSQSAECTMKIRREIQENSLSKNKVKTLREGVVNMLSIKGKRRAKEL